MRRLHLVELEDLPWFPAVLRDGATAYLEFAITRSGQVPLLLPPLERALRRTGATEIVDLCSGAAGPLRAVVEGLKARGLPVHARLTDRYPNVSAMKAAAESSGGGLTFSEAPVDAANVPASLEGFRTMFNAFHHLRPEEARAVLQSAADARAPIAVFEMVNREPLHLLGLLFAPLAAVLTVPLWRPFRWSWLFFSWGLPLLPLVILWDGLVSWLRIYGEPELRELLSRIDAPGFEWEIGRIRMGGPPVHASYLIGVPATKPAPPVTRPAPA